MNTIRKKRKTFFTDKYTLRNTVNYSSFFDLISTVLRKFAQHYFHVNLHLYNTQEVPQNEDKYILKCTKLFASVVCSNH